MANNSGGTIILDTNVISELMRLQPDPIVIAWYLEQQSSSLCTTSISMAEILFGLGSMPSGRRHDRFAQLARTIFDEELKGKVLPFDESAAGQYAHIRSSKRRKGLPMAALDAQIAAIALTAGASLATRNTTDFEHCGVPLINPWLS